MSLWTDERVEETVTAAYVHSHLRPNEQELLRSPLYFGGDLTDDTYLDWILTRAKRFYLILVATGVPDQIFGVIDDSYDDEDLPITELAVVDLRLSYQPNRSLDKRFYKTQFRFLTRVVGKGQHIRYADEEAVPVISSNLKSVVLSLGHEGTDRVKLPSAGQKVFVRRRIKLEASLAEEGILGEIATSRRLCHEHIVSVFGSYLHQGYFNVLSLPTPEWSLKTFLTDTPKSFGALPKPERRQLLINWPHCLASALSWLHENDESHGAIRPSNIQIDDSLRISFGLLDGDGLLRYQTKSDDIETYQYGPPERWKRAVTVQNTGSAAVSLPSGGRSGRRTGGDGKRTTAANQDPARNGSGSSTATFTYHPTSRGKHARLQLRSTPSPQTSSQPSVRGSALSPSDDRSISSHGTTRRIRDPTNVARAPSTLSSTGSHGRNNGPTVNRPMFLSSPEGRSAFVQTWQSVEQDMFASDLFSLGAVIMDILNLLCKRSYGSFQRHRSSKNRMAGRGGGLADASFHANLTQVSVWAQSLQTEAQKKAKKDEGQVYRAVGSVVQLALQCLEREPSARLTSGQLERKLGEHIQQFAGVEQLHCAIAPQTEEVQMSSILPIRERNYSQQQVSRTRSEDRLRQIPRRATPIDTSVGDAHRQTERIPWEPPVLPSPITYTSASPVATPATASLRSLSTFNFHGVSDTIVGESPRSRGQSVHRSRTREEDSTTPEQIPWSDERSTPRQKQWNNWHNNDSQVDPRLSFGESVDTGVFTYLNYSTSASSDEGAKFFPRPPSERPPKPPPDRGLPPVPPLPSKARPSKSNQRVVRQTTSTDRAPIPKHIADLTTERRPLRTDSLPKALDYGENDYQDLIRQAKRSQPVKVSSRGRAI